MMHQIAEKLPKERTGMYACCNPVPPLLRKYVSDFHQVVLNARNGKHIEQEIDADIGVVESVDPASSTLNVVPSYVTASRCAPHDIVRSTPEQMPTSNNFCADAVKPIQVSDPMPLVEQDLSFMSTAPTPTASASEIKDDPLFAPPPAEYPSISGGKAFSPIKLTAAEAIEVEDLGAKFRPGGASLGRSAQSRALANLKKRREQRNNSPQRTEGFDQNRLSGPQEDDAVSTETDVVILRDEKLKRLPKGTKPQVRQGHSDAMTTNLTGDCSSQPGMNSDPIAVDYYYCVVKLH
ncbi:Exosome component 10 [Taenia solium]|eukprot:TsM_000563900 transcript=TsM_000563900 gene=TsM_000563900